VLVAARNAADRLGARLPGAQIGFWWCTIWGKGRAAPTGRRVTLPRRGG